MSPVVDAITRALRGLRYGSVEITVHEGRVTLIERREKVRVKDEEGHGGAGPIGPPNAGPGPGANVHGPAGHGRLHRTAAQQAASRDGFEQSFEQSAAVGRAMGRLDHPLRMRHQP